MAPACNFLGRVPYREGLALQEEVAREVERGSCPDRLLLLEHPATITFGRRASTADLLEDEATLACRGIEIHRTGRGGGATVHGPGQLVGYPIVRLAAGGRRVRRFVAGIEAVLARVAAAFGVVAEVRPEAPGLWADGAKIAAIGIEIRRGVTRHGFALNVDLDHAVLAAFASIVPCRTPGLVVGDLRRVARRPISVAQAAVAVAEAWSDPFLVEGRQAVRCVSPD